MQARVGKNYASDDTRESLSFVRVLRRPINPSIVLDELRHIAAAVEGRSLRARQAKRQRGDVWAILNALGPTGWGVSSIAQSLQSQVKHAGCRWHVSIGFIAIVDSAEKRPGFVATVDSWSKRGEPIKRLNPISRASALLRRSGYRCLDDSHYQRWHRGLGLRAVNREIELLGHAMRLLQGEGRSGSG